LGAIQSVKNNTERILNSVGSLDVTELNSVMNSLTNLSSEISEIDLSQIGDLASLKTDILGAGTVTVLGHTTGLQSSISGLRTGVFNSLSFFQSGVQSSVTGLQSSISVLGSGVFNSLSFFQSGVQSSLSYYDTGVHNSISDIYSSLSEIQTIVLQNMGGIENIGNSSVYPLYVSDFGGFPNAIGTYPPLGYTQTSPGSVLILNPSNDNLSLSLSPCKTITTSLGWNDQTTSETVWNFSIFNVSNLYSISILKVDLLNNFVGAGLGATVHMRPGTFANVQAGAIQFGTSSNDTFCFYKSDNFFFSA
jgi:hypothetical protein